MESKKTPEKDPNRVVKVALNYTEIKDLLSIEKNTLPQIYLILNSYEKTLKSYLKQALESLADSRQSSLLDKVTGYLSGRKEYGKSLPSSLGVYEHEGLEDGKKLLLEITERIKNEVSDTKKFGYPIKEPKIYQIMDEVIDTHMTFLRKSYDRVINEMKVTLHEIIPISSFKSKQSQGE